MDIDSLLAILPQTQCEECGYKGCRPYAEAMLDGEAIDLCAPGGERVYRNLSEALNKQGDFSKVQARYIAPKKAEIDQSVCIGCTKCISPCPTQAIVGYKKMNHYVLSSDCTGCGLCVDYCPVDCIEMLDDDLSHDASLKLSPEYRALHDKKHEPKKTLGKQDKGSLLDEIHNIIGGDSE